MRLYKRSSDFDPLIVEFAVAKSYQMSKSFVSATTVPEGAESLVIACATASIYMVGLLEADEWS